VLSCPGQASGLADIGFAKPAQPQAATWYRAIFTMDGVAGNLRRNRRRTMRSPDMDAFP
jgi:hypothetical protein